MVETGSNFIYGAYPEDYTAKPEYAGQQTLVMVATKSKTTENGAPLPIKIFTVTNKGR